MSKTVTLSRETFSTSRVLEYFSKEELNRQMGAAEASWPLMLTKELIDNKLDACEAEGVTPEVTATTKGAAVTVTDNGPGLPAKVIEGSLDYLARVSDKTYYVSLTRGQLGNALKLLWSAPFVACGEAGWVVAATPEVTHETRVTINWFEQRPDIKHGVSPASAKNGNTVTMYWPKIASYPGMPDRVYFYRANLDDLIRTFAISNPCATLVLDDEVANLRKNGATLNEVTFMCGDRRGKRVELNAMTSEKFVEWLRCKFAEVGVCKVIPDDKTLADAYNHARKLARLQYLIDEAVASLANEKFDTTGLAEWVWRLTAGNETAWDEALWQLVFNENTE